MILALTTLLACQLAGEIFARGTGLPIPGPVVGLALLAAGLWFDAARRNTAPEDVERTPLGTLALALIANLGLLFVPAGVGIVQQLNVFGQYGLAIGAALVGSTVLALIITVATFRLAKRMVS